MTNRRPIKPNTPAQKENTVPTETTAPTAQTAQTTPETTPKAPEKAPEKKRDIAAEVPFSLVTEGDFEFAPQRGGIGGRPRSEYQAGLDKVVKENYGKPYVALLVDANEKAITDLTRRVRNSGEYLKLGIRIGELQESKTPGKAVFMFRVTDRITKVRTKKNTTASE